MTDINDYGKWEAPIRATRYVDNKLAQMSMCHFKTVAEAEAYVNSGAYFTIYNCETKEVIQNNMPCEEEKEGVVL